MKSVTAGHQKPHSLAASVGRWGLRIGLLFLGWARILSLGSQVAYGQARTGSIAGTVTDPEGRPLPGVTVTLTSATAGRWTLQTDASGQFRFPSLPPAEDYVLQFDLAGFRPVVRTDVEVQVGMNLRVDVQMAPGAEAAIVVRGQVPMVDVKKAEVVTHCPDEVLQDLPVARDPWFVLSMAPGVLIETERLDGGSEAARQSEFVARGADWHDNQWYLDGVPVTDVAVPGTSPTYFDFDTVEELQVSTGAADVEIFTGGVTVNFVTRRGQNRLSAGGRFLWANDRFQGQNVSEDDERLVPGLQSDRVDDMKDYGFQVGGAPTRDRLWLWAGYGAWDYDLRVPTVEVGEGEDDPDPSVAEEFTAQFQDDRRRLDYLTVKANARWGSHMLEALFWGSRGHRRGMEAEFERPPETTYDQKEQMPLWKLQDEWVWKDRLLLSGKLGVFTSQDRRIPQGGTDRPAVWDAETGIWHDSFAWSDVRNRVWNLGLLGVVYGFRGLHADQEVKFGIELRHSQVQWKEGWGNGMVYAYEDLAEPAEGGEVWLVREGHVRVLHRRWSLFGQDTLAWKRLIVTLGLRWDIQTLGFLAASAPAHPLRPDWLPGGSTPAQTLFTWSTVSPRLSLSYDLTGNRTTFLKASGALYPSALGIQEALSLAPTGRRELRFEWSGDSNGNGVPDPDEVDWEMPVFWDHRPGDPNRNVHAVASDYRSPKTLEFTVGLEGSLGDHWTVGSTVFYRRAWDYVWAFPYDPEGRITADQIYDCWVEAGRIPAEWGSWPYYYCTLDKPAGVLWSNRPDFHTRYRGLEFRVTRRMAGRWMAFGSLTLQDTTQFMEGRRAYVDPTNVDQLDRGPYFVTGWEIDDLRYVRWLLKIGGMLQLPWGFTLAGTLLAREGDPYLSVYRVDRISNGWGRTVDVITDPVDRRRMPVFWIAHMRLEKRFRLGALGRLDVVAEAFNLFNRAIATSVFGLANVPELYGKYVEIISPRIFRFGLRYAL
ncbi:MAG: carboxypeptidase regulatory-like domain-containing protein [Acidobacteria bacterium]|nr:carboxypeptidase regulatory-like domain-containing protein [Acidobacteriota bacterium]MDW7983345.1 carboxypeptidase regulatory-like domain-containing protein [Acidobacteriota bacterium]